MRRINFDLMIYYNVLNRSSVRHARTPRVTNRWGAWHYVKSSLGQVRWQLKMTYVFKKINWVWSIVVRIYKKGLDDGDRKCLDDGDRKIFDNGWMMARVDSRWEILSFVAGNLTQLWKFALKSFWLDLGESWCQQTATPVSIWKTVTNICESWHYTCTSGSFEASLSVQVVSDLMVHHACVMRETLADISSPSKKCTHIQVTRAHTYTHTHHRISFKQDKFMYRPVYNGDIREWFVGLFQTRTVWTRPQIRVLNRLNGSNRNQFNNLYYKAPQSDGGSSSPSPDNFGGHNMKTWREKLWCNKLLFQMFLNILKGERIPCLSQTLPRQSETIY